MTTKEYVKRFDWIMMVACLTLMVLGLTVIYTAGFYRDDFLNFRKQLFFIVLGLAMIFAFAAIDWRFLRDGPYLTAVLYVICIAALAGLLFFGKSVGGSRSWYNLGPVSFDPIELIKVVLIMVLAKYFSLKHTELYKMTHIIVSGVYVALPVFLILLQPEFGSVLVIAGLWFGILFGSGIKLKPFLTLCLISSLLLVFFWFFLIKDFQKDRIYSFIFPSNSSSVSSWNLTQAKIAIGSGGIFGKGFAKASQVGRGFLPASQTDFVYAGIIEQFGLWGGIIALICLLLLVWRIIKISFLAQSNFPRIFCAGLAISIAIQAAINLSMSLGLFPIVGVPLPLVSYGGSSMLATCLGLGIVQSMKIHT